MYVAERQVTWCVNIALTAAMQHSKQNDAQLTRSVSTPAQLVQQNKTRWTIWLHLTELAEWQLQILPVPATSIHVHADLWTASSEHTT